MQPERQSNAEMDWVPTPDSSNILGLGYIHQRSVLLIDFKDKEGNYSASYEHSEVPPELFEEFKNAESAGSFYYKRIRGNSDYPATKL